MSVHSFLSPEEFYAGLLADMQPATAKIYGTMKHTRIEAAYRNRKFTVYKMKEQRPIKLTTISVLDFVCDDQDGSTMQIIDETTNQELLVGYTPVQVFDYPIFVHLPVNNKLRWSARKDNPTDPSLSFLMVLRTRSRLHLREQGIIYMETSLNFDKEFNPLPAL